MSLKEALADIEKLFGKGAVMEWGSVAGEAIEAISTGCLSIDSAIGIGGLPKGRIIEIYGQESAGKTTLALQVCAEAQREGGKVAYIDVEHALDPLYAAALGVDVNHTLISQPDSGESALDIIEALVRSGEVSVVVVDSVAALTPRAELDGSAGDSFMGLQARLMGQAMRKLVGVVATSNTCLIFINQLRDKIGVSFGSPTTTTGGKALKFYASVRLEITRIGQVKKGEEVIGSRTKVKVVKNKMAPPFKTCEFDIIYGEGISREADLIELATTHGIISKGGAWLSYNGEQLGQGKEKVRVMLKENTELRDNIEAEVKEKLNG